MLVTRLRLLLKTKREGMEESEERERRIGDRRWSGERR
jgi:hypothetical protein